MSYIIITDSSSNLTDQMIKDTGIDILTLSFRVGEQEFSSYDKGLTTDNKRFYDMMRNGEVVTTTLLSYDNCYNMFENIIKQDKDVFFIGFSSGLSGSYNVSCLVAEELRIKYPERKIIVIDSLAASMGEGLIVYYAMQKQKEGMSLEAITSWIEQFKFQLCHWFTVDDLMFLKRGGRISGATALAGTLLGIKPIMHVDNEGHLVPKAKVRGRKASLATLVKEAEKNIIDPKSQTIFISHGDCIEDAEYVAKLMKEKLKVKEVVVNYVEPVIGAHSGPGTVALFYVGDKR